MCAEVWAAFGWRLGKKWKMSFLCLLLLSEKTVKGLTSVRLENWGREAWKVEKKMTSSWLFILSSVISQLTHLTRREFLQEVKSISLKDVLLWIEIAQPSTSSSLSMWETAAQNENRRPVTAGMVNRVSYLLQKQMMSQKEERKFSPPP